MWLWIPASSKFVLKFLGFEWDWYLERITAAQPWDYFCLFPETTDSVHRKISLCSPSLSLWSSLIISPEMYAGWWPGCHWQSSWELTQPWNLNEDDLFHVGSDICWALGWDQWQKGPMCQYQAAHWQKNPFIFNQNFLNKAVWFGGKDMSELGHCFLMLLSHLGERELESSSPRYHFPLMLPV